MTFLGGIMVVLVEAWVLGTVEVRFVCNDRISDVDGKEGCIEIWSSGLFCSCMLESNVHFLQAGCPSMSCDHVC
jgi:hypothetical protein